MPLENILPLTESHPAPCHRIPLDIRPASLEHLPQFNCAGVFRRGVLRTYRHKPFEGLLRSKVSPQLLREKVFLNGFDIDFNSGPLLRRSLLVRREEWLNITSSCIEPKDFNDIQWGHNNVRIERPVLSDFACIARGLGFPFPALKHTVTPAPEHKVASISAGILFDAALISRSIVSRKAPSNDFDPISFIIGNDQVLSNPFKVAYNKATSKADGILEEVMLRRKWESTQISIPKTTIRAESCGLCSFPLREYAVQSRRDSKTISNLLRVTNVGCSPCGVIADSTFIETSLNEFLNFAPHPCVQSRIEKPVFGRLESDNLCPASNVSVLHQDPELFNISVVGLKELCLESYQTWFVRINRTGLRARFQFHNDFLKTNATWKMLHPPSQSFQFLEAYETEDYMSDSIETLLNIAEIRNEHCSIFSSPELKLQFEPVSLSKKEEATIEVRALDIGASCKTDSIFLDSQVPHEVINEEHQFDNWNSVFDTTVVARNGENTEVGDTFFNARNSDSEDTSTDHRILRLNSVGRRTVSSSLGDDGYGSVAVAHMKPDTPFGRPTGVFSFETMALTTQPQRNADHGQKGHRALTEPRTYEFDQNIGKGQTRMLSSDDDDDSIGVANVKPDTPLEKSGSVESSETVDLTTQRERNDDRPREENWSPTDDLLADYMDDFEKGLQ